MNYPNTLQTRESLHYLPTTKTGSKIAPIKKVINFLLIVGILLIPFSNTSGRLSGGSIIAAYNSSIFSSLPILAFGFPFLILGAILIGASILGKDTSPQKHAVILYFFSLTSMIISLLFSPELYPALFRMVFQLCCMIISLYITSLNNENILWRDKFVKLYCLILTSSGAILALYFITNTITMVSRYGLFILINERGVGKLLSLPWGASNMISAILLMPFFTAMASLSLTQTKREKFLLTATLIIIGLAILLTLSRTTLIILVATLLIQTIITKSFKLIFYIFLVSLLFYAALQLYNSTDFLYIIYTYRIADTNEFLQVNGRVGIWQKYVDYIVANSFIPIGYYGSLYKYKFSGHNFFLTTMAEQGFWGVLASLAIYFWAARLTIRRYLLASLEFKNFHLALLMGLLAVFANLQFEDANYTQQFAVYHWAYLGLLFVNIGEQKQEKGAENPA